MRLKYYKKEMHTLIKDSYFKHFQHLSLKDTFINGTFTIHTVRIIENDGVTPFHNNMVRMLQDWDGVEMDVYVCKSDFMKTKDRYISVAQEIMEHALDDISDTLREVINILSLASPNSCMTGGAVRDIIAGLEPKDFDFVTDMHYDGLRRLFEGSGFKVIETGLQFLVLTVSKNDENYEIANFRKDGTYTDGRRPDYVSIGTLDDDAERRDFTINAVYYKLLQGSIIDPTGLGLNHISNNILHFIGDAQKRVHEDMLRVIRAYRFIGKGFSPTPITLRTIRCNFECAIKTVASERIKEEIEKMVL